ncbi:putative glycerol-3-phosphate transporter 1 [Cryptomeria japonica]|uniref:putative glycerol-3-phosphate transporter 1 n=1 Tax=Cryptomeria japonica TaxID=3369 RepID=UPI0027D9E9BB|nr:putative glycerol-3-phosphate transporter 1 [Cryptomeria japonica]
MEPPGISFLKHYRCFNPTIKVYQSSVLIITFIAYACFHASRKPISIAKGVLKSGWKPFDGSTATARLGEIDVSFLLVYSIGMFFAGHVGDRVDLRIFLTVGMIGSGTFVAMFGMGYWFNIHSFFYYLCMQVVQGLFQATGWPSVVAIVGNWFGKGKRGLIMGIWNAHTSIGNICGSLIAVAVLQYGWGWSFLLPGILVAVAGIIVYLFLVVNPEDVVDEVRSERINLEDQSLLKCGEAGLLKGTLPPTESHRGPVKVFIELSKTGTSCDSMNGAIDPSKAEIHGDSGDGKHDIEESTVEGEEEGLLRSCTTAQIHSTATNAVGFVEAWMIPGVASYALCLFFSKLVAYTFLYWLPFYIKHSDIGGKILSHKTAGNLSTLFDVGGVMGGILAGHISDRLEARAITAVIFLYSAIPALLLYRIYGSISMYVNIPLMMAAGLFVNGPYSLITTAVSADLGTHNSLKGNSRALATVTAIIDGTGSVGAALGPLLTGYISARGWDGVFIMLMLATLFAALLLTHLVVEEIKDKFQKRQARRVERVGQQDIADVGNIP